MELHQCFEKGEIENEAFQSRAIKRSNSCASQGRCRGCVLAFLCAIGGAAHALTGFEATDDLKRLSVEELMNLEITSVSKTEERFGGAAAAIAVVTAEDIRRSGATTIPEALRLVPGIHVARRNSNSWAVSARGFSSVNSEKLLVLSDTRSVYTPLFSGVFWDVQDQLMEDIDRIEVIRGPGAALWGSNAVNGVINITTKRAQDTQGLYANGGGGTEERAFASIRYGGATDGGVAFRVHGKYFERDDTFDSAPQTSDDWRLGRVGFRMDWDATAESTFTLQGDAYRGNIGQLAPAVEIIGRPGPSGDLEVDVGGGNVLGRWRRRVGDDSDFQLRFFYDRTRREDPSYYDSLDTFDLDWQHRFPLPLRNDFTWGLNYRFTSNTNEGKGIFNVDPATADDHVWSGFAQNQYVPVDALRFTLGVKLEQNDFSGFETQPSVSAAWDISPRQTLWASAARAVRVPTRLERDIAIDVIDPASNPIIRLLGSDDFESEELLAYELGYRWQATETLSFDLAAFSNRYEGLASLEFGEPFVDPRDGRTVVPVVNRNLSDGSAEGAELQVNFAPLATWRLMASYSYVYVSIEPNGLDLNRGRFLEGSTPRHQFGVRSYLDLPAGWQIDLRFRRLSAIESIPNIVTGEGLPAYSELDVRLAWRATDTLELAVIGANLLDKRHVEFGDPATRGEIERSVYGSLTWRN
jgi:iron complex outermembrane receptor protein